MYPQNMAGHDLGKFGFKKIKRFATKAVKVGSGYTIAKPLVKKSGKVFHKAGKIAGKVIGVVAGGLGPPQDITPLDSGIERGSDGGGESSLPFGLSPLMLGLLIGVPVVLFMVSKKS